MADTEPEGTQEETQVESKGEDVRIPKARLDQEAAKRRAAEERASKLEEEIKALKETKPTPDKVKDKVPETRDDVSTRLSQIEESLTLDRIERSLQLSDAQAREVYEILREAPKLAPSEALSVARSRNAELFGSADNRGFDPSQHGGIAPSGGGAQIERESEQDKIKKVAGLHDKISRDEEQAKLLGGAARRAMGWE